MITRHRGTTALRLSSIVVLVTLGLSVNAGAQDRLPPIPTEKMTEAQKSAAAEFAAVRKTNPTGPFGVMLRVPELMTLVYKWREHVQFRSVLDQRLTELAILITARRWTQQYEWNAHAAAAMKAGVKPEIVSAVAEGRRPSHMAEDEEALYDFCIELHRNQSVSDSTYARALSKFGESGVVEAASIEGYYTLLAMVMNTARTALPAGAELPLTAFPR